MMRLPHLRAVILVSLISLFAQTRSQNVLQPLIQTEAIPSTYTLLDEIKAWRPLSVFYNIMIESNFSKIIPTTALRTGILIFAPINSAFARSLYVFFPEARKELTDEEILEFMLTKWQTDLVNVFAFWPDIKGLCEYHSVPKNYSERAWSSLKEIITMYDSSRHLSPKFPLIYDHDHSYITKRLARQVETTTGRLNFVSNILWPIDARTKFIEGGGPFIGEKTGTVNIFEPLLTLKKFIDARNDLMFVQAMMSKSQFEFLKRSIESEEDDKELHIFLPNDIAFLAFIKELFPVLYDEIVPKGDDTLGNLGDVNTVLENLLQEWIRYGTLPRLNTIMMYHLILTQQSLEDLQAAGSQKTAAADDKGVAYELTVTTTGVKDNDKSRPDAKFVTYYRTGTANATVVDTVLSPFSMAKMRNTIEKARTTTPKPEFVPKTPKPGSSKKNETEGEGAGCFPGDAILRLSGGDVVHMRELQAGHMIATDHERGFNKVFLFSHRDKGRFMNFIRIATRSGHVLELSQGHYVYANGALVAASRVLPGDILDTASGRSSVLRVDWVRKQGVYAPHTQATDLIVNGVRVSAYTTAVHPKVAHALLAPVRWLARRGVQEPLGSVLYRGGRGLEMVLPSGSERY